MEGAGNTGGSNTAQQRPISTAVTKANSPEAFASQMRKTYDDIVEWRQSSVSARAVAGVNFTALLIMWLGWNWSSIFIMSAASLVVVGFPLSRFLRWQKPTPPNGDYITDDRADTIKSLIKNYGNLFAQHAVDILFWTDVKMSALALGTMFLTAIVLSYVTLPFLAYIAINVVLLKKPATITYNKYGAKQIDPYLRKGCRTVEQLIANLPTQLTAPLKAERAKKI